jgi:hypothetical protein
MKIDPRHHSLQGKVSSYALNNINTVDKDFDGDEIYLEDLWQQTIHVPKVKFKSSRCELLYSFHVKTHLESLEVVICVECPPFVLVVLIDYFRICFTSKGCTQETGLENQD